jgi:transcriptional regulator with XRE-family HTH domain
MAASAAAKNKDQVSLGRAIRAARVARGLSLASLADLSETDKGQLSKIENGLMEPPLPRLRRIARELGISAADLLR